MSCTVQDNISYRRDIPDRTHSGWIAPQRTHSLAMAQHWDILEKQKSCQLSNPIIRIHVISPILGNGLNGSYQVGQNRLIIKNIIQEYLSKSIKNSLKQENRLQKTWQHFCRPGQSRSNRHVLSRFGWQNISTISGRGQTPVLTKTRHYKRFLNATTCMLCLITGTYGNRCSSSCWPCSCRLCCCCCCYCRSCSRLMRCCNSERLSSCIYRYGINFSFLIYEWNKSDI